MLIGLIQHSLSSSEDAASLTRREELIRIALHFFAFSSYACR
jgi:hypothetical protein